MILPIDGSERSEPTRAAPRGTVYLVGAGPGDPDLLTVAAARLIRRADVVVHDALIGEAILDLIPPGAERIDVGKRCGGRRTAQERIHEILVEAAGSARTVVRLKGGDPFVFGRGGEEALALRDAGVRFRVVPGVTAGVGVSAYAGIPVTHRGLSTSVTFVTGHEDVGRAQSHVDWEALARIEGTLVVYMGVGSLASIAKRLVAAGKPATTPAAIVEWGTFARQRTISAPLTELPAAATKASIGSPALVVIGEVAALRERLDWFGRFPLRGRRVVVARSRPQPSRIGRALARLGADVTEFPRLESVPAPLSAEHAAALGRLGVYAWSIFTSPAGVRHFWRELAAKGLDTRALGGMRVAAFGAATSRALRNRGIVAEVETRTFDTGAVVRLLGGATSLSGTRIVFPRERDPRSSIADALRDSGASVDELVVFASVAKEGRPGELLHADLIVLPSSSAAREVARALDGRAPAARVVAIGPSTAQTALGCGLLVDAIAADHTVKGVVAAVRESLGADDAQSVAAREEAFGGYHDRLMDALPWQAWLALLTVVVTVAALAQDWVAPAAAILGADLFLLLTNVITVEQAFSGFSNPAPVTVAALFIVARAVERSGALQPMIMTLLGRGDSGRMGLARLLFPTAAASAFLNNTPIVAMLAPQVADWAEKNDRAASWFLMPLSFAAILGGTVTVIGTSTNLVISGLMEQVGMAPIGMFEITRLGLPVAIIGVILLVFMAPSVLPDRRMARQSFAQDVREYVFHSEVTVGGPLDGKSVEAAGLRSLQGVFLAEIERSGETIAPAAPTTVLRGGDRLAFVGRVDQVRDLQMIRGLISAEQKHASLFNGGEHTFFEAVVSGASSLVGKTLKESAFRSKYQAAVLGIHRAGERVQTKLGEVPLKEGDTLLVLSDTDFSNRWRDRNDFLLVSRLGGSPPLGTHHAWLAAVITLGIVVVAGLGLVPILHASLLGAALLVMGKALTPAEARRSVELDVLIVIAASFGIGEAISSSGLADVLGHGIVQAFSGFGPLGILFAVVLATVALTEAITNNAAAVLVFPIAVAAAAEVGADPRPFCIALAVAASASFLTPIGYQTNTMVYGMGGYRFSDFSRLGFPLTILVVATIMIFVPLFWSF